MKWRFIWGISEELCIVAPTCNDLWERTPILCGITSITYISPDLGKFPINAISYFFLNLFSVKIKK
jgi:hypothetical protein